jgi:hypothetical protein
MLRRVALVRTDVFEKCIVSIIRVMNWQASDPNDGDDTFQQNVGSFESHTVLHPRRWHFCGSVILINVMSE